MVSLLAALALAPFARPCPLLGHSSNTVRDDIHVAAALMPALLTDAPAPLETQSIDALRTARENVVSGQRDRGLAALDSLVMSNGVTVSMEASGAMEDRVVQGVESWNAAMGESAFRVLPAGSPADVTVRFVRSVEGRGTDVQGMVDATREMSWGNHSHAYKLHGVIYVRDNVQGRPLRPEEVVNVVAHECGHLLGLADTTREDRLMGPMVVGHTHAVPAADEVSTVREYRALVRQCYPKG